MSIAMPSYKLALLLLFLNFLNCFMTEALTYLCHNCSAEKSFPPDEDFDYFENLRSLFDQLTDNATGKTEFYNTSVADANRSIDTLYGLFMCRGDVTPQVCHQCVNEATDRLGTDSVCPSSKEGIFWHDECMVRFSNRSFFSTVDTNYEFNCARDVQGSESPSLQISNLATFKRLLFKTMNETAEKAAKSPLGAKKFATKQANVSRFQSLYCLAQCTPDLSTQDCRRCLGVNIGYHQLPDGLPPGIILFPSCIIRYDFYPFYNSNARVTNSSNSEGGQKGQDSRTIVVVVVVSVVVAGILFCFAYCFVWTKMKKSYKAVLQENFGTESTALESLQFSLATIEAATNKFSHENKIGKGGFGEVYKGILFDGRQVAIKRLSRSSGQGAVEFKNEILVIAKLQHRNLVTLLGFCLEGEEKILVYEYVPNNSLDYFLFGTQKRNVLNWPERYQIIGGIAQGILYLHKYSRLKIIHRDLKPSNILLDDNMNPKISDFGMAKIVGIDEDQGSTNRVVGTFGYMSPEYAMFGQYSEKSDIFSFGVIVMEIISGKKNASCYDSQYVDGLLSYVWKQWRNEKWLEILDPNVSTEVGLQSEVIKCIQIGLLCVQENPNARPSMVTVVSYLSNDSIQLPFPQEPAFFMHGRMEPPTIGEKKLGATSNFKPCSINEMSMSIFCPR